MTQEEKVRAYDEALERVTNLENTTPEENALIEYIFPQLCESEDERIRKDIIGGLMWQRDNLKSEGPHDNNLILPGFCFAVGKHLAYLEKQKDASKAKYEELKKEFGD